MVEGNWWWHGGACVREHAAMWDIYKATKRYNKQDSQNNKPSASITAVWMANGPRLMGTRRDKPATSPEAILQIVKCGCSNERCSTNRSRCYNGGLNCTNLCTCANNGETCDNDVQEEDVLYSDEENISDDDDA